MGNYKLIANFFLRVGYDYGDLLTNLKLQKLVYYAQAFYLAKYGKELFEEDFQAWIHGPVLPELYNDYSKFRYNPIQVPDLDNVETIIEKAGKKITKHLNDVCKNYFDFSAYKLEHMTHDEDPWKIARGNLSPNIPSKEIISKSSMKEYYKNLL